MFDYSETSSTLSIYLIYVCIKGIINTYTGLGTPFWQYMFAYSLNPKYSNIFEYSFENGFEYSNMDLVFESNHYWVVYQIE